MEIGAVQVGGVLQSSAVTKMIIKLEQLANNFVLKQMVGVLINIDHHLINEISASSGTEMDYDLARSMYTSSVRLDTDAPHLEVSLPGNCEDALVTDHNNNQILIDEFTYLPALFVGRYVKLVVRCKGVAISPPHAQCKWEVVGIKLCNGSE